MKPFNRLVGMLLLSAIAACNNGDQNRKTPDPLRAGLVPGAHSPAQTVEVMIQGMAFVPSQIEVPAGTTVVFTNADIVLHTATAFDATWSSGNIGPGGTWRRRFIEPGIYAYYCSNHLLMRGALVVR